MASTGERPLASRVPDEAVRAEAVRRGSGRAAAVLVALVSSALWLALGVADARPAPTQDSLQELARWIATRGDPSEEELDQLEAWAERLTAQKDSPPPAELARLLVDWLTEELSARHPEAALRVCALAEGSIDRSAEPRLAGLLFLDRGNAHLLLGQNRAAVQAHRSAALAFEDADEPKLLARARMNAGIGLGRLGQHESALEELEGAEPFLADPTEWEDRHALVALRIQRGSFQRALGRYEVARETLELTLPLARECRDGVRDVACIDQALGLLHRDLGHLREALLAYDRAEQGFAEVRDARSLRAIHDVRALVWELLGRDEEVASHLFASLNSYLFDERNEHRAAFNCLELGTVLARLSRFEEAEALLLWARSVYEANDDRNRATRALLGLGFVYRAQGKHDEALEALAEAFVRSPTEELRLAAEFDLALLAADRGGFGAALDDLARLEPLLGEAGERSRLLGLHFARGSMLQETGRPRAAMAEYLCAVEVAQQTLSVEVQALGSGASVSYRGSQARLLSRALATGVAGSQDPFLLAGAYEITQSFHGLGVLERRVEADRGRPSSTELELLRAELRGSRWTLYGLESAPGVASMDERREWTRLRAEIKGLASAVAREEETVSIRSAEEGASRVPGPASLREVQQCLDAGEALLEYLVDGTRLYAFAITSGSARLVDLGDGTRISGLVEELTEGTTSADRSFALRRSRHSLQELGRRVLEPILAALPPEAGIHSLAIAPDGELVRVPFEALLIAEPEAPEDPSTWPFLVRSHRVAYVPSGTVLRELHAARRARGAPRAHDYVGIAYSGEPDAYRRATESRAAGDSSQRGSDTFLPWTEREVIATARLFAGGREELERLEALELHLAEPSTRSEAGELHGERFHLFLGRSALESVLEQRPEVRRASIVHIACHAQADLELPELSFLALAGSASGEADSGNDGLLLFDELRELPLQGKLLVLSACDTLGGRLQRFDGALGMAHAALAAGADGVLATLWRVRDEPSKHLMRSFFDGWIRLGRTPTEALAAAKREAIAGGALPGEWAGYVLWGDGGS